MKDAVYYESIFNLILDKKNVDYLLNHPLVSKIQNNLGDTPLHLLAEKGELRILRHEDYDSVLDKRGNGWTPLELLLGSYPHTVTVGDLRKYGVYILSKYDDNVRAFIELIRESEKAPESIKFIDEL